MVDMSSNYYIFFPELAVIALQDAGDVARAQRVAVLDDEETVAFAAGQHRDAGLLQLVIEICSCFRLSFAAGLAAEQFVGTEIFHVPPEVRGEILGGNCDRHQGK